MYARLNRAGWSSNRRATVNKQLGFSGEVDLKEIREAHIQAERRHGFCFPTIVSRDVVLWLESMSSSNLPTGEMLEYKRIFSRLFRSLTIGTRRSGIVGGV